MTTPEGGSSKLWGGRFSGEMSEIVERFNASIDFDKRLYREDIAGSIAHAHMLAAQGIISAEDGASIERGLTAIGEPVFARYDPPFMPWLLRRNEIQIRVQTPAAR